MREKETTKILWDTFSQTGKIGAYLLYRAVHGTDEEQQI